MSPYQNNRVLFAIILKKSKYDLGSYLHHHLLQEHKNKLAQSCNVQRQRLEVSILKSKGAFQAKQINTVLVLHVLVLLQDEIKVGKRIYNTHFINYFLFQY